MKDGEGEPESRSRATKVLRRMGDGGEGSQPRRSLQPTNNLLAYRRGPEITAVAGSAENEGEEQEGRNHEVEMMVISDGNDTEEEIPVRFQPSAVKLKNTKKKAAIAPINWMKGQVPYTIQDALNEPSPGLNITLPQLLDCAPRLRRDLAELLRSSISKNNFHFGRITPVSGRAASAPCILCALAVRAFFAYHVLRLVHPDGPFSSPKHPFCPTTVRHLTFLSPASGVPLPNCPHWVPPSPLPHFQQPGSVRRHPRMLHS